MTIGDLALFVVLLCLGLLYCGLAVPPVLIGVAAIVAAICVLVGRSVIIGGPKV